MSALRFRGPVLPDGEARDLYVVDGRVTYEQQAGAETVGEGWIVPGLVDAHCHLGLDDHGAIADEETEAAGGRRPRRGRAADPRLPARPPTPRWIHDRDDLPRLIRAGRHIARTKRYIRNYAHEVEPDELAAYVAQEAQRGDGWVKLVGDWISRDDGRPGAVVPAPRRSPRRSRPPTSTAPRSPRTASATSVLPGLIEAGIDCIEHGTGLTDGPDRRDGRPRHRAGADGDAARQVPRVRRGGRARSSRRTPPR